MSKELIERIRKLQAKDWASPNEIEAADLIENQGKRIAELEEALHEQIDLTMKMRDTPCPRCESTRMMRDRFDMESA